MAFTGSIEDRLAIRELLDSYADAVCRVDAEAWGDTWAENGTWVMPDYTGIGTVSGRATLVTTWTEVMKHVHKVVMTIAAGSIEVSGDRAEVRCYTTEVYDYDGATQRASGRYDDVVVRENGTWRFERRTFQHLHQG